MTKTKKLTLSALFIALGIILPFFTGQVPHFGNMLLPMHIPVLLCGFVCGNPYGMLVGAVIPLLRSLLLGRPVMMPTAVAMAVELAVYGAVSGLLYTRLRNKKLGLYISLLAAMLSGRMAWGFTCLVIHRFLGTSYTWEIFATEAFVNAIPGIIVQLILIPAVILLLRKSNLLDFSKE